MAPKVLVIALRRYEKFVTHGKFFSGEEPDDDEELEDLIEEIQRKFKIEN